MSRQVIRSLTQAERELKDQCEEAIRAGLTTFAEVGQALMTVRDGRLYRDKYASFEDYCTAEWQISRPRGYELMNAARVVSAMADTGLPAPANERQARELAKVPEEEREEVWKQTLDATDGKPTAADIKKAATPESQRAETDEAQSAVDSPPPSGPGAQEEGVSADEASPASADTRLEDPKPAKEKPPVWMDDDPEVIEAHRRRRVSKSFAEGVAFVWAALDPDPVAWLGRSWDPSANPFAGMESMTKVFAPDGLRRTAEHLIALADHLDQKGETL